MKSLYGITLSHIVLVCLTITYTAIAQDLDDVTISGIVTDSNGDALKGALVKAASVSNAKTLTVTTDNQGRYWLIDLAPGVYKVSVSAKGFGTIKTKELETISAQNLQLNFTLAPAAITAEQTVTVSDTVLATIDTTRTIVGGTITGNEIEALPNASNDVLDLVYSLSGTAEEPLSIRNLAGDDRIGDGSESDEPSKVLGTGSLSLAGGVAYSTNITIDGLDNNDDRSAEERFQPPVDSVAEVQVISNQFSAEYGRASGGRINIKTKAGARKFRGRFSMFFEDDNLNANTYNNNRRGLSRLPFAEYAPGGTLSGPIPFWYFKNRTYFFSSYSYRDRNATTQIFTAVPVVQNSAYPLPSPTEPDTVRPDLDEAGSAQIGNYILRVDTPQKRHRLTQRIDHNFTDAHNLTFNYQFGRSVGFRQYRETTRFLENTLKGRKKDNDSFYVTDNYVVNSNFVNQIRFQFSKYSPGFSTENPLDPVVLLSVKDETQAGDPDQIRGTVVVGNSTNGFANVRQEKRYQVQETVNLVIGNHNLRVGADIQRIDSRINELFDSTGTYNFDSVNDFVANQVSRFRRNSGVVSTISNTYSGFFVQNDWRFRSNITMNFGLRYEKESLIDDSNNFGPRLALAYSPGEDGKSVIRIGGGVFYNRALLRTIDDHTIDRQQVRFDSNRLDGPSNEATCYTDPAQASRDECVFLLYAANNFPTAPTLDEIRAIPGIANLDRAFSNTSSDERRFEDDIKIPESYQFNVGYERDLGRGFAFETNFTYTKAVRLWREQNVNAFVLPNGFSNYTDYLLSLGDVTIPGTSSGTDTYRFELGDRTDAIGDRDSLSGGECRSSTALCIVNLNTLRSSTSNFNAIGIARRALRATLGRPNPLIDDRILEVGSMGKSVYAGLSLELRRRFRDLGYGFGSSMRFSYVLSRTRDDGHVDTSSAQIRGDFKSEFARSLTDRTHKFRFSGTIELSKWLGRLRMSPIIRVESGRPFNISIGGSDRNLDDERNDRPNYSGDVGKIVWHHPDDPFPQTLFEGFSLAPIGSSGGNLPRNAGSGPGLFMFDLNVSRQFRFSERFRIRPQVSFTNILNATVFSFGTNFIGLENAGSPEFERGFLTPSRTLRQRKIQLGLRVDF